MFDRMTLIKIVGGVGGALLVFLLGRFVAEQIYYPAAHGDGYHQAYVIDTGEEDQGEHAGEEAATEEPAAEEPAAEEAVAEEPAAEEAVAEAPAAEEAAAEAPAAEEPAAEEPAAEEPAAEGFAALVAAADPADGKKVFRKCKSCHVPDKEQNRVGPHLLRVVGRAIAGVDGYKYSSVFEKLEGVWTHDELNAFLEDPKAYAPGTKMSFRGLKKEEDRAAVIAYLESLAN